MKYSQQVQNEVQEILKKGNGHLVLIRNPDKKVTSIVNKLTHMVLLIDDEDIVELLIAELDRAGVEVFEGYAHLEEKYRVKREKPMFWPSDKPWPYEEP